MRRIYALYYVGMPRIARPPTQEVRVARREVQAYLKREGLAAAHLAVQAGVGQPTVSRLLSGRTKTITPEVARLLAYAAIEVKVPNNCIKLEISSPALSAALGRYWDGSEAAAEVLARLIEAVAPALVSLRAPGAGENG